MECVATSRLKQSGHVLNQQLIFMHWTCTQCKFMHWSMSLYDGVLYLKILPLHYKTNFVLLIIFITVLNLQYIVGSDWHDFLINISNKLGQFLHDYDKKKIESNFDGGLLHFLWGPSKVFGATFLFGCACSFLQDIRNGGSACLPTNERKKMRAKKCRRLF